MKDVCWSWPLGPYGFICTWIKLVKWKTCPLHLLVSTACLWTEEDEAEGRKWFFPNSNCSWSSIQSVARRCDLSSNRVPRTLYKRHQVSQRRAWLCVFKLPKLFSWMHDMYYPTLLEDACLYTPVLSEYMWSWNRAIAIKSLFRLVCKALVIC